MSGTKHVPGCPYTVHDAIPAELHPDPCPYCGGRAAMDGHQTAAAASGCPDWCTAPHEPFELLSRAPGVFARFHEKELAVVDNGAVLVLLESEDRLTVTSAGAELVRGVPLVGVYAALEGAKLTASQTQQLAGALLGAAATLEQVTR